MKPSGPHVRASRTGGRKCAYTVDLLKGAHRVEIAVTNKAGNYYRACDTRTPLWMSPAERPRSWIRGWLLKPLGTPPCAASRWR